MNDLASIPLFRAMGWTLLHSLWQGAVLALLAALALRMARHRSAELRYALASGALALLVFAFLGTLMWISGGGGPLPMGEAVFVISTAGGPGLEGWAPRLRGLLSPWMPWLFAAWAFGFSLRLLQMGWAMVWLYGPCLGSLEAPPPEWTARFEALRTRHHVARRVRLGLSRRVDSLLVLGWLKPVVLVPAAALLALPPEALEALLVHELAHVRRGDFLANLVQTLAESILFYHPAVWWLSRRIRQEREHCCDDAAVQACGDPILYASALAGLEELRMQPKLVPDLAPAASGGHLMSRIQRLLRPQSSQRLAAPLATFIPVLLVALALGVATLSASSRPKPAPAPATAPPAPGPGPVPAPPSAVEPPPQLHVARTPSRMAAAASATPLAEDPVEVDFKEIRVKSRPPQPAYPEAAKAAQVQGTVELVLTIDQEGQVTGCRAISGPPELQGYAADWARLWEFEPALVKGKPVVGRFTMTIKFVLR